MAKTMMNTNTTATTITAIAMITIIIIIITSATPVRPPPPNHHPSHTTHPSHPPHAPSALTSPTATPQHPFFRSPVAPVPSSPTTAAGKAKARLDFAAPAAMLPSRLLPSHVPTFPPIPGGNGTPSTPGLMTLPSLDTIQANAGRGGGLLVGSIDLPLPLVPPLDGSNLSTPPAPGSRSAVRASARRRAPPLSHKWEQRDAIATPEVAGVFGAVGSGRGATPGTELHHRGSAMKTQGSNLMYPGSDFDTPLPMKGPGSRSRWMVDAEKAGVPLLNGLRGSLAGAFAEEGDGLAANEDAEEPRLKCNCKKSRCLKLYCDCFAAGQYCGPLCNCSNCLNTHDHADLVNQTRRDVKARNPHAFEDRFVGDEVGGEAHKMGCKCKKSRCVKKYCECYAAGVKCTDKCKCVNCLNADPADRGGGLGGAGATLRHLAPKPFVGNKGTRSGALALAMAVAAEDVPVLEGQVPAFEGQVVESQMGEEDKLLGESTRGSSLIYTSLMGIAN